jgi:hypothetical protein
MKQETINPEGTCTVVQGNNKNIFIFIHKLVVPVHTYMYTSPCYISMLYVLSSLPLSLPASLVMRANELCIAVWCKTNV